MVGAYRRVSAAVTRGSTELAGQIALGSSPGVAVIETVSSLRRRTGSRPQKRLGHTHQLIGVRPEKRVIGAVDDDELGAGDSTAEHARVVDL